MYPKHLWAQQSSPQPHRCTAESLWVQCMFILQPCTIVEVGEGSREGGGFSVPSRAPWPSCSIAAGRGCAPSPECLELPGLTPVQQTVPPLIHHIPLLPSLQNGPFKAQAKRYSRPTHSNTGSLLYSAGQDARPSSSQAQIPFHSLHTTAVSSQDGYLGKGLGAGELEKQDALPLTRAIFTQRSKQACSVPLPPGRSLPASRPLLSGIQHLQSTAPNPSSREGMQEGMRTVKRKQERPERSRCDPAGG